MEELGFELRKYPHWHGGIRDIQKRKSLGFGGAWITGRGTCGGGCPGYWLEQLAGWYQHFPQKGRRKEEQTLRESNMEFETSGVQQMEMLSKSLDVGLWS